MLLSIYYIYCIVGICRHHNLRYSVENLTDWALIVLNAPLLGKNNRTAQHGNYYSQPILIKSGL